MPLFYGLVTRIELLHELLAAIATDFEEDVTQDVGKGAGFLEVTTALGIVALSGDDVMSAAGEQEAVDGEVRQLELGRLATISDVAGKVKTTKISNQNVGDGVLQLSQHEGIGGVVKRQDD